MTVFLTIMIIWCVYSFSKIPLSNLQSNHTRQKLELMDSAENFEKNQNALLDLSFKQNGEINAFYNKRDVWFSTAIAALSTVYFGIVIYQSVKEKGPKQQNVT
jgi:hypothetical protein